ncbi:hypothetical protein NXS98_04640 [Fontisphaera persica]|uniref:hypothetical protein n=1 Tax=Fontisphaera persica TaxID=2974023 RepID=UPI0024C03245|nr:hypothetical protein [Fontisphaera persica]WCJ60423.1 hypothetical protein NXS98_04640 [Fontisphaera persica]
MAPTPRARQALLPPRTQPPPTTLPPPYPLRPRRPNRQTPPPNRLRRRTPPARVRPPLQPQRHRPRPPPTPSPPPTQKETRHQKTPPRPQTELATLLPTLRRYQVFTGHSPLLAPNEPPPPPRFQYTVREPVSGACFTGYADELSKSYATLLATQLSAHLAAHGVNLTTLVWQTDNGSEFQVNQHHQGLPATVRALGSDHRFIPPKRYTWQSDVETVHRLVEDEFFDRETFSSPQDFWAKITTYWLYFNLVRPNRGKEWQSPLQILNAKAPALAGALIHWLPLNLSQPHHPDLPPPLHRGHDLPSFP